MTQQGSNRRAQERLHGRIDLKGSNLSQGPTFSHWQRTVKPSGQVNRTGGRRWGGEKTGKSVLEMDEVKGTSLSSA